MISHLYKIIGNEFSKEGAVSHYLRNHGNLPLWILVNFLTFGNIHKFYLCCTPTVKTNVAKDFSNEYKLDYGIEEIHFSSEMLESILKTINYFRNICAHVERLYTFKLFKAAKSASIAKELDLDIQLVNKGNVFTALAFLKLVTFKEDYQILLQDISQIFDLNEKKIKSIEFSTFTKKMGFPSEWMELLLK